MRQCLRFDYISSLLRFLYLLPIDNVAELIPEVYLLRRQQPRLGEEAVLLRKLPLHLHKVPRQEVLPADYVHAWKVVHFLEGLHFSHEVGADGQVMPGNVPELAQFATALPFVDCSFMIFFKFLQFEVVNSLSCFLHDVVLCAVDIYHYFLLRFLLCAIFFFLDNTTLIQ